MKDVSLADLQGAQELRELNELLTTAMAERKIQALIKDDSLQIVTEVILNLAAGCEPDQELVASAILGRLAAVARGREATVFEHVDELFSDEPRSIDSLSDGDEKAYAAQVLRHINASWVDTYSLREAVNIDTADIARRELLDASLMRHGQVSAWIGALNEHASAVHEISNSNTRLKRVRRILVSMGEVANGWQGEVGKQPGEVLAQCAKLLLQGQLADVEQPVLIDVVDAILGILRRAIELRFSHALHAETYQVVEQAKKTLGLAAWSRFLEHSQVLPGVQMNLLEAALVLARQNRTDGQILSVMRAAYPSIAQLALAVKKHFSSARDLDPDVAEWWCSGGTTTGGRRKIEHKVGNTEDQQIGALLIEVESSREVMEKLERAIAPLLEVSDPVLAVTVKKAASNYTEMAQIARRLARMRKLSKTDLRGERVEYNPREHEMLGGHQSGVRTVRVARDGIKKEFGGRIKMLVKPLVESDQ